MSSLETQVISLGKGYEIMTLAVSVELIQDVDDQTGNLFKEHPLLCSPRCSSKIEHNRAPISSQFF